MKEILRKYVEGHYEDCVGELKDLPTGSFLQDLTIHNNILASEFQLAFITRSTSKGRSITDGFLEHLSRVSILPHHPEFNFIRMCSSCNTIYSLLAEESFLEGSNADIKIVKASETFVECLQVLASSHQILIKDTFETLQFKSLWLVRKLLESKRLQSEETLLLLYMCVLTSLITFDENHIQLLQEVLKIVENSQTGGDRICDHIFILSPKEMPLQSKEGNLSVQVLYDISRLCLMIFSCQSSSSLKNEAMAIPDPKNPMLIEIHRLLKMYIHLGAENQDNKSNFNGFEAPLLSKDDDSLKFGAYLLQAAKFASLRQPLLALKMLNYAGNERLCQTKACSIITTYSATQFKVLRKLELEMQAWQIAEESLTSSPTFQFSFHTEICGFVLTLCNFLSLPRISTTRFHLARNFLQCKQYGKAADLYETLSTDDNISTQKVKSRKLEEAFELALPSKTVVFHEYILALILAKQPERAITMIESELLIEDYLVSFLHAEAFCRLGQSRKAVQHVNRSIIHLNSKSFHLEGAKSVIMSKLRFKLAKLFVQVNNTKDAFHQLRLAMQCGPVDDNMKKLQNKLCLELGVDHPFTQRSEDTEFSTECCQILKETDDYALNYLFENFE